MKRFHLFALVPVVGLLIWKTCLRPDVPISVASEGLQIPEARPVDAKCVDIAVACMTLGVITPSAEVLGSERFDSMVEPIARVLEMHLEADFDAYLQAYRSDIVWANKKRAKDVAALKATLATDLGVPLDASPNEWVEGLRVYWSLMYAEPVLVGIDPSSSRVDLQTVQFDPAAMVDLTDYEGSFEIRRSASPVRINNAIALPHRRTLQELASHQACLTWFDFQANVVLGKKEQHQGSILLRFVWDGLDKEWFLSRAVTIYPDHFDLRSSRCVLLF